MSSLQIIDDPEKLDSSMTIVEEEQNNTERGQDCPPTVRKKSTSKERTPCSEKYTDDKSNSYEERREDVQTQDNTRKRSSRSEVDVDKSNGHGSNEKVLKDSNKKRNIASDHSTSSKSTSHSQQFNRSNNHESSVSSSIQTHNNRRNRARNPTKRNDCVLYIKQKKKDYKPNYYEDDRDCRLYVTYRNDCYSRKRKARSERADRSNRRKQFRSSYKQKYMVNRDRVKSTIPQNRDLADNHSKPMKANVQDEHNNMEPGPSTTVGDRVKSTIQQNRDLADNHSKPMKANVQDKHNNMQPGPSTAGSFAEKSEHGEEIAAEQQVSDYKSDTIEDSMIGLDSEDVNDCEMISELSDPWIMSTERSPRSRSKIDVTSPTSRRHNRLQRKRSSASSGHQSYYSASYSKERSRSSSLSLDYFSFGSPSSSASYSDRRSRQNRHSQVYRSSSISSTPYVYLRLPRTRSSPYSRYRREGHDGRYRSDHRYYGECHDRHDRNDHCELQGYRHDRHDRNDRREFNGYRLSSRDSSLVTYRPAIKLLLSLEDCLLEIPNKY